MTAIAIARTTSPVSMLGIPMRETELLPKSPRAVSWSGGTGSVGSGPPVDIVRAFRAAGGGLVVGVALAQRLRRQVAFAAVHLARLGRGARLRPRLGARDVAAPVVVVHLASGARVHPAGEQEVGRVDRTQGARDRGGKTGLETRATTTRSPPSRTARGGLRRDSGDRAPVESAERGP